MRADGTIRRYRAAIPGPGDALPPGTWVRGRGGVWRYEADPIRGNRPRNRACQDCGARCRGKRCRACYEQSVRATPLAHIPPEPAAAYTYDGHGRPRLHAYYRWNVSSERAAHRAYVKGIRSPRIDEGERAYQRRRVAARRSAQREREVA